MQGGEDAKGLNMRWLILLPVLLLGALGAAWYGGEAMLARRAERMIADDARITAASVAPQRSLRRIGLALTDVQVETPRGRAALPRVDLWAAPTAPNAFHATLPQRMTVTLAGRELHLGAETLDGLAAVSPLHGMAVGRVAGTARALTLDGQPLLGSADVDARLAPLGAEAPAGAGAAYDVTLDIEGLTPQGALPRFPVALAPLSAWGGARAYLDRAPAATGGTRPQLTALRSTGLTMRAGGIEARLAGQLGRGADGRAQGAVFLYTADLPGLSKLAADLGALPQRMLPLAGTAITTAAAMPLTLPAGVPTPADPAPGETRVPLILREGKAWLGPMALGPAPPFPG